MTQIDAFAFYGNNLSTVSIPENVTIIGYGGFYSNRLTRITLSEGLVEIADDVFKENQLISVTLPKTLTKIGNHAFSINQITSVNFLSERYVYSTINNPTNLNNVFVGNSSLRRITYCAGKLGWPGAAIYNGSGYISPTEALDEDCDGIADIDDIEPGDPDTDSDGLVNSIDTDDDNDGIPDLLELETGRNPLAIDYRVTTGSNFSCALDNTGVVCWGDNSYGQTTVPSLFNPVQLDAGVDHICAIEDSGVVCWGRGEYGNMGKLRPLNYPTLRRLQQAAIIAVPLMIPGWFVGAAIIPGYSMSPVRL